MRLNNTCKAFGTVGGPMNMIIIIIPEMLMCSDTCTHMLTRLPAFLHTCPQTESVNHCLGLTMI